MLEKLAAEIPTSDRDKTPITPLVSEVQSVIPQSRQLQLSTAWTEQNNRRVFLIKKHHREGLTEPEMKELDQLHSEASRQINAVFPLPFDALEKLEACLNDAEGRQQNR